MEKEEEGGVSIADVELEKPSLLPGKTAEPLVSNREHADIPSSMVTEGGVPALSNPVEPPAKSSKSPAYESHEDHNALGPTPAPPPLAGPTTPKQDATGEPEDEKEENQGTVSIMPPEKQRELMRRYMEALSYLNE